MNNLSIIIPNWNGERQLKKNLPLLFNVLAKFNGESEVIIIDDQSEDGSRGYLKELKKEIWPPLAAEIYPAKGGTKLEFREANFLISKLFLITKILVLAGALIKG